MNISTKLYIFSKWVQIQLISIIPTLVVLYLATAFFGVRFFSEHAGASRNFNAFFAAFLMTWIMYRRITFSTSFIVAAAYYFQWLSIPFFINLQVVWIGAAIFAGLFFWGMSYGTRAVARDADAILQGSEGAEGEVIAGHAVRNALASLGVWYCTNQGAGFQNAVLPPEGNSDQSSELDVVVATAFGIYAIEAKNWKGGWGLARNGMLKPDYGFSYGSNDPRENPLSKTQRKLERLTRNVTLPIVRKALVINTHPEGKFLNGLPDNFVNVKQLKQFFADESQRNQHFPDETSSNELREAVFSQLDKSPTAKHDHLMRLPPTTKNIKFYQEHHKFLNLKPPQFGKWNLRFRHLFMFCLVYVISVFYVAVAHSAGKDVGRHAAEAAQMNKAKTAAVVKPASLKNAKPKMKHQ